MSSCVPSGNGLPSSCIRGTKEKPKSFFSPFSFAAWTEATVVMWNESIIAKHKISEDGIGSRRKINFHEKSASVVESHWSSAWARSVSVCRETSPKGWAVWSVRPSEGCYYDTGQKSGAHPLLVPQSHNKPDPEREMENMNLTPITFLNNIDSRTVNHSTAYVVLK